MTKEELRATYSAGDILRQYGVVVCSGRCKAICHSGNKYTAKVGREIYYCFKCNRKMDIFDITAYFNNCDFKTAFEILGGGEKPTFRAVVTSRLATRERQAKMAAVESFNKELHRLRMLMHACRGVIDTEGIESTAGAFAYNKLQYCEYKYDAMLEDGVDGCKKHG